MLENFDFDKTTTEYSDQKTSELGEQLDKLQRKAQALNVPVLILIDGWESSGKGEVLKNLSREMDPRYVRVEVFEKPTKEEKKHPMIWRYWQRIPNNQEFVIYDRSFYSQIMNDKKIKGNKLVQKVEEIWNFEQLLLNDGYIILKFFLNISEETQKERIEKLEESDNRDYLVSKLDTKQNKHYNKYQKKFDKVLEQSNKEQSPWYIINAEDTKEASKEVLGRSINLINDKLEKIEKKNSDDKKKVVRSFELKETVLDKIDLTKKMSKEEYEIQKEELQQKAANCVYECYVKGIPIVLAFEGVDAAGKGGAIQRLTRMIDPRSYKIYGIKAPTEDELAHNYLWRFSKKMPQDGLMTIFDRSWYGRVLVERVEGFAEDYEWERAYDEINQMEKTLTDHGTIALKYFLYVDNEEQELRFKEREENPDKQYKITEEDWRNRDKWDDYLECFEEMLQRTNTENAPWKIIATNDKYLARINVLQSFIAHVEKYLDKD